MAKPNSRKNNPQATMALGEHFREFRNRLIKAALATLLCAIAGFFLYDPFIQAISDPFTAINEQAGRNATLNYASVASPFDLLVRISLYIGLVLACPVWLYQLWAFITPALYKREKIYALSFVFSAVPMFFFGIWLAWVCLPTAIRTLLMFNPEGTDNIVAADVYIGFVVKFMLVFGIAFVLPVLLVGLNFMGLLSGKTIKKSWRWVIVLVAFLAAMAAPGTDIMTMFYLMAPLLIFFFVAVLICLWNDKRRAKKQAKLAGGLSPEELDQATSFEDLQHMGSTNRL